VHNKPVEVWILRAHGEKKDWACHVVDTEFDTILFRDGLHFDSNDDTSPQSNLRRARCNGTPKIHPQNCSSPSTITTPSNTPIPSPTPLTTPNGIRIQSAVLAQYTFRTHTHRWSRQQVRNMSAPLVMLIESDALIIHDVKRRFQAFIIIGLLSVLYGGSSLWPDLRRYIQTVWLNRFRSRIPSTPMLMRVFTSVCSCLCVCLCVLVTLVRDADCGVASCAPKISRNTWVPYGERKYWGTCADPLKVQGLCGAAVCS